MFNYNPEFWTPQLLTEVEVGIICNWLMAWQKACKSADCVDDGSSKKLDPAFLTAMDHVQSLIRHIHALKNKESNK